MSVPLFQGFVLYYRAPDNAGFQNVAVHLAVARVVFGGVLFCAVLFPPQDVLDENLDGIESVPEDFSYLLFKNNFGINILRR